MKVSEILDELPFIENKVVIKEILDEFAPNGDFSGIIDYIYEEYPGVISDDKEYFIAFGLNINIQEALEHIGLAPPGIDKNYDIGGIIDFITDPENGEFIKEKFIQLLEHYKIKASDKIEKIKQKMKAAQAKKYRPERFKRIVTRADLQHYIRMMLGEPAIKVDVTDEQISQIITDTIQKFTLYAYGTPEAVALLDLEGKGTYKMPNLMRGIIGLRTVSGTGGVLQTDMGGFTPDYWTYTVMSGSGLLGGYTTSPGSGMGDALSTMATISAQQSMSEKFFGNDLSFNYNQFKNEMQLHQDYSGPAILFYFFEYIPDESGDLIFDHTWVKNYALQKTKFLWGSITGKFSQNLVGNAVINHEALRYEAQQAINDLENSLIDDWSDPPPTMVG